MIPSSVDFSQHALLSGTVQLRDPRASALVEAWPQVLDITSRLLKLVARCAEAPSGRPPRVVLQAYVAFESVHGVPALRLGIDDVHRGPPPSILDLFFEADRFCRPQFARVPIVDRASASRHVAVIGAHLDAVTYRCGVLEKGRWQVVRPTLSVDRRCELGRVFEPDCDWPMLEVASLDSLPFREEWTQTAR